MPYPPVQLIVGLGNPGARYADTRHNAGFWLVEAIAHDCGVSFRANSRLAGELAEVQIAGRRVRLLKPETFVNASGRAVGLAARYFDIEPEAILVAHDELDLAPGSARLKFGGGHGGHNGLRDIIPHLGSPDFLRLRLGVGHPGHKSAVTGWVLTRPSKAEDEAIDEALDRVISVLPDVVNGEVERAMKSLHTSDPMKQKQSDKGPTEGNGDKG